MPLPPALLSKLAKRGLVAAKSRSELKNTAQKGFEGCPNKYNIYHECSKYCITRWKVGVLEPNVKYLKKIEKLLKKYPLPPQWKEVYDRGCGKFYYWHTEKDLVSWLPPNHPRANVSYSAAYLREDVMLRIQVLEKKDGEERRKRAGSEERDNKKEKTARTKNFKKSGGKDHLDPMDPAAYSDIPRGTWSSGLETRSEAKTGADTTAAGPLFQMRPYPSPGAILAANAKTKHTR